MSDITADRYIAERGGLGLVAVKKIQAEIFEAKTQRLSLRNKYGAVGTFENAAHVKGLILDPPPATLPPGLVKMSSRLISEPKYWDKVFAPNPRSGDGRKLQKEFAIPIPGAHEFHNELTRGYNSGREIMMIQTGPHEKGGYPIGFCVFETFKVGRKEHVVISVPRNWTKSSGYQVMWKPTPEHNMTAILASTYWKWREAAEKKAKAKEAKKADA